ncbi:MAG TPA: lipid-binding protein [Cyclobacteriaceae bacterium]|nr:lipid-binding protein [Cyclobacteriaceae bacterium]
MKNISIILFAFLFALASCDEDDPNVKETTTKDFAGEWWVTYSVDGDDVGGGHSEIITSNSAANIATEIIVSDYVSPTATSGNFWSYKVKAQTDPTNKSFSANEVISSALYDGDPYDIGVNILNGKIFPEGGHSKTGVVVDSIYFEIQFEDDSTPYGTTYVVSGHKRTGFTADDY